MLARVQLEVNPEQVFADSVAAIRSREEDYQLYGMRAIEQIIKRQNLDESELSQENKNEARYLFDELRKSWYDTPEHILREANDIYVRHFEK